MLSLGKILMGCSEQRARHKSNFGVLKIHVRIPTSVSIKSNEKTMKIRVIVMSESLENSIYRQGIMILWCRILIHRIWTNSMLNRQHGTWENIAPCAIYAVFLIQNVLNTERALTLLNRTRDREFGICRQRSNNTQTISTRFILLYQLGEEYGKLILTIHKHV